MNCNAVLLFRIQQRTFYFIQIYYYRMLNVEPNYFLTNTLLLGAIDTWKECM